MAAGISALPLLLVCFLTLWAPASTVAVARRRSEGAGRTPRAGWDSAGALAEAHGLRAAFQERFAAKVHETFAAMTQPAILTVAGSVERQLANFLLQAGTVAEATQTELTVVSAVLDAAALDSCGRVQRNQSSRLRVVCLDVTHWLPACPSRSMYLFVKPLIFQEAVRASDHGVLMMDIDVILYRDLLGWAAQRWQTTQDPDRVLLMTGTEGGGCCNTGTVFATKASLPLMALWAEESVRWYKRDNLGDQRALVEVVAHNLTQANATLQQIYLIPKSVVLQECQKCKCSGGCRKCSSGGPLALHYNCMNTHVNMEHDLSSRGDWSNVDGLLGKKVKAKNLGPMGWAAQACKEKK